MADDWLTQSPAGARRHLHSTRRLHSPDVIHALRIPEQHVQRSGSHSGATWPVPARNPFSPAEEAPLRDLYEVLHPPPFEPD